jgi:uncharacterized protein YbaR (Trm112 family)
MIYKIILTCPKCKSKFFLETDDLKYVEKIKNTIYCNQCKVNLQEKTENNKKKC